MKFRIQAAGFQRLKLQICGCFSREPAHFLVRSFPGTSGHPTCVVPPQRCARRGAHVSTCASRSEKSDHTWLESDFVEASTRLWSTPPLVSSCLKQSLSESLRVSERLYSMFIVNYLVVLLTCPISDALLWSDQSDNHTQNWHAFILKSLCILSCLDNLPLKVWHVIGKPCT